jgi:hypothetical protein
MGRIHSLTGSLITLDRAVTDSLGRLRDTPVFYVTASDQDEVLLRPEVPSDMPCGQDDDEPVGIPPDELPVLRMAPRTLFDPSGTPLFHLAYPKGC